MADDTCQLCLKTIGLDCVCQIAKDRQFLPDSSINLHNVDMYLPTIARRLQTNHMYGRGRMLFDQLSTQARLVIVEMAAIIIQKLFRRRLQLKTRIRLAEEKSKELELQKEENEVISNLPNYLIDEICISLCVKISMDCLDESRNENDKNSTLQTEIELSASLCIREIIDEYVRKIVAESIRELTALHVKRRKKVIEEKKNMFVPQDPAIIILNCVFEDEVQYHAKDIVKAAINESVEEYIRYRHIQIAYELIENEMMDEIIPNTVKQMLLNSYAEHVAGKFQHEVVVEELNSVVEDIITELKIQAVHDMEAYDLLLLTERVRHCVLPRLLLGHLALSVGEKFNDVILEHTVRGVIKRMAAERLSNIMNSTNRHLDDIIQSRVLRSAFTLCSVREIQTLLVQSIVDSMEDVEDQIDRIEESLHIN